MQANLAMAVLLGFVLIAASACGGNNGSEDELRTSLEEERQALEEERKAREEERKAREEAERKLEEERKALEEERQAREEAERKRQEEEQARREAEEAEQEAETRRQEEEERRQAAEQERQRLAEAERQRRAAAAVAQAKAAFTALGGGTGEGLDAATTEVEVTPRYGQTATVMTTPSVDFASKRRSSSGRWSITTLSNDGSSHRDDLVVYSDIGGPNRVLFTEHSTYTSLFLPVEDTNNIRATLSGNTHPIASARFPGGGRSTTFEHTIDSDLVADGSDGDGNTRNDYDTTRFAGTFDGASGTFECTGTCTVAHEGGTIYNLSSGTWTFTTGETARAPVPDDSYMYFGWWKREQKSDESVSFEMFSGGMHEVDDIPDVLTGTATYSGPAVGQYAIYQPLGTQTTSGSFTARAQLTADFGATGAEGTLSGRVTNFSNASDWSVTLKSATITGGAVSDGDVSWTIGGNTEDGGMWDAKFFSDVDGFTGYPQGVAGTFDGKFADVGRLIGAFGAHCPASTCPRN